MRQTRLLALCVCLLALWAPACSPSPGSDAGDVPTDMLTSADIPAADVPQTDVPQDDVQMGTDAADTVTPTDAPSGATMFFATLTGGEEVPPVATAARGTATFSLNAAGDMLSYTLMHNVTAATMAHIHEGEPGVAGPVVIPLMAGTNVTGSVAITAAQATALRAGNYYVNVHSPTNPAGEIRGQVLLANEALFTATMSGAQEVPAVTSTATGSGWFVLNTMTGALRWSVTTSATATAGHIHGAPPGVNGGVLVDFMLTGATTRTGTATLTEPQRVEMVAGRMYANVHTAANPGGEIRGQIVRPGETLYGGPLRGAEEVPPVTTTNEGGFGLLVDVNGTDARYVGAFTAGLTATAAHIHAGAAGVAGPVVYPLMYMTNALTGTLTLTAADITALNAGTYYANVHSAANPGGEIRGQLIRR